MSKTAGQMAYEAFTAVRYAGALTTAWTSPSVAHKAWEAAAAAVETEQLREIRADRDQLKKRMLDLASAWKDEAADDLTRIRPAPGSSARTDTLNQCASQVCKGLDI